MNLMKPGDIAEQIKNELLGEGIELEAKAASGGIPRNAWETISAFANTNGGVLIFGLVEHEEFWEIVGVSQAKRMVQDLHTSMRDRAKISSDVCGQNDIWVESIDGRELVVLQIKPAPRRNKPVHLNGDLYKAYIRRDQNDARCTPEEVERMRREATPSAFDFQVLPHFSLNDFDMEAVGRYREMSEAVKPGLPHHRREAKEFLQACRAWRQDRETNKEGPTVAGILMFGAEAAIAEIRPNHVIDYRRISVGGNAASKPRWMDRVRCTGNLFTAWEEIYLRLLRGLPVPFRLQGSQRRDEPPGQEAIREAFVNLLVHTDYQEMMDAVILHYEDRYEFSNPGDSWANVADLGIASRPERRNPTLATLFQHIGLAEQAGSGYIAIFDEWRELGYRSPLVISDPEQYRFHLTLPVAGLMPEEHRAWLDGFDEEWSEPEELALLFARHNAFVDNASLRKVSGQHPFDASQTLRSLRDRKYLVRKGLGKNTVYVLGLAASIDHNKTNSDHNEISSDHLDPRSDHNGMNSDHKGEHSVENTWDQLVAIAQSKKRGRRASIEENKALVISLCTIAPLSNADLTKLIDRGPLMVRRYINDLVAEGILEQVYAQDTHPDQRYRLASAEQIFDSQMALPFREVTSDND